MTRSILNLLIFLSSVNLYSQRALDTTEVLVLGTPHLANLEGFESGMLAAVIDKLDSLEFGAVCIEKMRGRLMYDIRSREDSAFAGRGLYEAFTGMADTVRNHLGIDLGQAEDNIEELLGRDTLSTVDRVDLLLYFLAITDLPSATLQLAYLGGEADRLSLPDFTRQMIRKVGRCVATNNEYYTLALPVARRASLNRLYPIDNLQDEAILLEKYPDFAAEVAGRSDLVLEVTNAVVYQRLDSLRRTAVERKDFFDLYRFLNGPDYAALDYLSQWALWFRTGFDSGSDRARYSLWEMRNLQIAAEILRVAAFHPGERVLVIIGASHRGFLDKYLRQVPDLKVMDW